MSNTGATHHAADVKTLHDMGYAQELSRRMGHFSNFAISFSIICILSGGINSLGQGTSGAGGAALGIGWIVGGLAALMFALEWPSFPQRFQLQVGCTTGALYLGDASGAGLPRGSI